MILYFTYRSRIDIGATSFPPCYLALPSANALSNIVSGVILELDGFFDFEAGNGYSSSKRFPRLLWRSSCCGS